jgi:hypothetical protein
MYTAYAPGFPSAIASSSAFICVEMRRKERKCPAR